MSSWHSQRHRSSEVKLLTQVAQPEWRAQIWTQACCLQAQLWDLIFLICKMVTTADLHGILTRIKVMLYLPTIPLQGIYPEQTVIRKDTCTPMLITALCTISKTWTWPKYPPAEEWVKTRHTHTVGYYSAIKKKGIMPSAATWTDLEITTLSEGGQRHANNMQYHLHVESNF